MRGNGLQRDSRQAARLSPWKAFRRGLVLVAMWHVAAGAVAIAGDGFPAPLSEQMDIPPAPAPEWTSIADSRDEVFRDAGWSAPPGAAESDVLDRLIRLEESEQKRETAEADRKAAAAKRPTVKWSAEMQDDQIWTNQDDASLATYGGIPNGNAFRRMRIAMFGDYRMTEYKFQFDYAQPGRPSFLDVYGGLHDLPILGRVRVGQFFEPYSLERVTSNTYAMFLERSFMDQAFVPARNNGIAADNTWAGGYGTWSVGTFHGRSDNFGDQIGAAQSLTGRITYLPWYDEATGARFLHLGAGYSFRSPLHNMVRFRAQPEARIGAAVPNIPFLIDTGNIAAHHYQLFGLETAWVYHRLSFQSEFTAAPVDTFSYGTANFYGWYAYFSYFLTDDHREYDKDSGTFTRHHPKRPFLTFRDGPDSPLNPTWGPGAWEVAYRVSQVVLNDGAITGGRETNLTLGINWYLTGYTRVTANWIRAAVDSPLGGPTVTNILGLRFQYDF